MQQYFDQASGRTTTIYDDGSMVVSDQGGGVISSTDQWGVDIAVPGAASAGNAIVRQFANLLDYWGRSEIDARNRAAALANQVQAQRAGIVTGAPLNVPALLLLAGAALLVFKLVK